MIPGFLRRQMEREIRTFIAEDLKLDVSRENGIVTARWRVRAGSEVVTRAVRAQSAAELEPLIDLLAARLKRYLLSETMRPIVWKFLNEYVK
ncbi:hypothetical protein L6V77_19245 [Myxococcota bacterium]|nr:hypothetical protein [Myxococcota bacterium]